MRGGVPKTSSQYRVECQKIVGDVDVLAWWHDRCNLLPVLSTLAPLYVFTSTATSDVERLFSIATRIGRAHRVAKLDPNMLEVLVILKSRIRSQR